VRPVNPKQWTGAATLAASAALAGTVAARLLKRRRHDSPGLLLSMRRHPAAQRARYRAPCRHTVTANNPYDLVLNTLKHSKQCPTLRMEMLRQKRQEPS
jgi:hypothetical protein